VAGLEREDLGANLGREAGSPKGRGVNAPGVEVAAVALEGVDDQPGQRLCGWGRRVEVPARAVGVFEHDPPIWCQQLPDGGQDLRPAPQRRDLEPRVHEVEGVRLEGRGEDVVVHQPHVGQALGVDELLREVEQAAVDIGADDLALRANPFAEHPKPAEGPAAEVHDAAAAEGGQALQEPAPGRLPDQGLEAESLKLAGLPFQQVCRAHGAWVPRRGGRVMDM
jgi:hypothetical protein